MFAMPNPHSACSSSCAPSAPAGVPDRPVDGKFEPIAPGTGFGYAICEKVIDKIEKAINVAPDAVGKGYKSMGLPKGILAGIVWHRAVMRHELEHMPPATYDKQYGKDQCKSIVEKKNYVVSKFLMWLLKARDLEIDHMYSLQHVISACDLNTIVAFVKAHSGLGFKQSTLKAMEFNLGCYFQSMLDYAKAEGMGPGTLEACIKYLKTSSASRGKHARAEAKQKFTKAKQMEKLGATEQPTPELLWDVHRQCFRLVKNLLREVDLSLIHI